MDPLMNSTSLSLTALPGSGQAQASKLSGLQTQAGSHDEKKLKQAAKDFEAIFVQQMLEAMDKTVDRENSILSGGSSEQYFRSMLNEEISKSMTNRLGGSGFGLADAIYRQMAGQIKPQAGAGTMNSPTPINSNGSSGSRKTGEVEL